MKCGIAALSLFLKHNNDRIPYFDIHYSLVDIRYLSASGGFAFSKFLSRSDWTLAAIGDARIKLHYRFRHFRQFRSL
jgi:hypothetical protein